MRSGSVDDGREAVGPVMAVAGEAADARAVPAHHQPIAVVLDFVNPQRAGRRPGRLRRQARFDEAGGRRPWPEDRAASHRFNRASKTVPAYRPSSCHGIVGSDGTRRCMTPGRSCAAATLAATNGGSYHALT